MLNCKFCNKECKNLNSQRNHELRCKENPNRTCFHEFAAYNKRMGGPWNKGKTIKNNPELTKSLRAGGITMAAHWKETGTKPHWATDEFWTDERRKEKSEWRKKLHKENPNTHPNKKLAGNKTKMSYPEKVAYEFLKNTGIVFEHNKHIDKYWVDFCINNIIIEIDGKYWHNAEQDETRDRRITNLGYKIFRISAKDRIEDRISEILKQ